ncbi:MAG: hypothetical protein K2Q97_06830 [Burkholderiaceae bacterium]|nr:hypothetical protein [Burkholderiaceae bacterium]
MSREVPVPSALAGTRLTEPMRAGSDGRAAGPGPKRDGTTVSCAGRTDVGRSGGVAGRRAPKPLLPLPGIALDGRGGRPEVDADPDAGGRAYEGRDAEATGAGATAAVGRRSTARAAGGDTAELAAGDTGVAAEEEGAEAGFAPASARCDGSAGGRVLGDDMALIVT